MNKNRIIIILSLLFVSLCSFGQNGTGDIRTRETKIADLLAQMPAENQDHLNMLMNSMAGLGEDGLVQLAGMLTPSGKGNDASVRFAMGGFSKFVTGAGQENTRQLCQRSWCRALEAAGDPDIKSFIIAQIQQAGDAGAVPFLEKYLLDESLSDPAARALVTIGTPGAGQVLLNSLGKTQGTATLSIIEALGNIGYTAALPAITPFCSEADVLLRKTALFAVSQFGSPQSSSLLYDAALKTGFTFEPTLATASYLMWIERLIASGNKTIAAKYSTDLIGKCIAESQVHTRSVSLSLLVDASGSKAAPYLYDAFKSNNREYWMAALRLSVRIATVEHTQGWVKTAGKLDGQAKADVIGMLGQRGDAIALPFVQKSLGDKDEIVRQASIEAMVRLQHENALPGLISILKKGSTGEISTIRTQLLSFAGDAMIPAIAAAIPDLPPDAKIAMMEVLAARKSTTHINLVFQETRSENDGVRLAALKALNSLVTEKDLEQLFVLLGETRTPDEMAAVQEAVITAVKTLPPQKQTTVLIPVFRSKTGAERKALYRVLAGVGHDESLEAVVGDFNTQVDDLKAAAFESLTQWSDPSALAELYRIGMRPENAVYREPAFNAGIHMIHQSEYPDDQKLLLLEKVTDLAGSDKDKIMVLNEVSDYRTYLALKFASGFLDIPALQADAARAVSSIALSGKSLFGDDIKALLGKCMSLLTGPEAEYGKEAIRKHIADMPAGAGFVPMFNGKDLSGWKGLVENPVIRSKMEPGELAKAQAKADEIMQSGWRIDDGILVFTGHGESLCTTRDFADFEMIVDWKITERGDAGIYLRGSPQVQIWDTSRRDAGAQVGSGGLYNNEVNERNPLQVADNPIGEWNTFRITMIGERVTVYLNGKLVVDNIIMENYWDRSIPIFSTGQIELQAHGTWVGYRNLYIREIHRPEPYAVSAQERSEGFVELFDGISMFNFTGNTRDYVVEDGLIAVYPEFGGKGNLYTKAEYGDFSFRFEFQLTPGANNGIGIRAPMEGDAAYLGMEIQVLDNTAAIYRDLKDYQYHGSVYGVIPAKREYLKPVGEWNEEEIIARGNHITVILNGTTIVDGDIGEASKNGTPDHNEHPGLKNSRGHIGFLGHGSVVKFRNLRVRDIEGK